MLFLFLHLSRFCIFHSDLSVFEIIVPRTDFVSLHALYRRCWKLVDQCSTGATTTPLSTRCTETKGLLALDSRSIWKSICPREKESQRIIDRRFFSPCWRESNGISAVSCVFHEIAYREIGKRIFFYKFMLTIYFISCFNVYVLKIGFIDILPSFV